MSRWDVDRNPLFRLAVVGLLALGAGVAVVRLIAWLL